MGPLECLWGRGEGRAAGRGGYTNQSRTLPYFIQGVLTKTHVFKVAKHPPQEPSPRSAALRGFKNYELALRILQTSYWA